jgi:hypothetical protein
MNDEFERVRKENSMIYRGTIRHLSQLTEFTQTLVRIAGVSAEIRTEHIPNTSLALLLHFLGAPLSGTERPLLEKRLGCGSVVGLFLLLRLAA